jgi:hypothetical protein
MSMPTLRPIHVVFVHGLFSSAKVWTAFEDLIGRDPDLSFVTVHCFEYSSPVIRLRIDRRIAEIDDIADRLRTYLTTELSDARALVLVSHSQGGLVVLRFLARMLARGQGRDLARIRRIVMYACPNSGAEFLLSVRKLAVFWRNPQERELRPFVRAVVETQQTVLRAIVNAQGVSDNQCRIPIVTCGGISDKVVPPIVSTSVFPSNEIVDGDHFSVVRPADANSGSYRVLKTALLAAGNEQETSGTPAGSASGTPAGSAGGTAADANWMAAPEAGATSAGGGAALADAAGGGPALADAAGQRQNRVSVAPPFGRRDAQLQGRGSLIAAILSADQKPKVHVLVGNGGSGKSRLALEIAYRAEQAGWHVWWISVLRVNSCMREVANQLGAPESQVERAWRGAGSATDLVWRFLDASGRRWLLVFDNADEPQSLGPLNGPVSDGTGWLRLPSGDGMVIVTSRDRDEVTWGPWCALHPVLPLDDDDGASLLMELVGPVGGTFQQARSLSSELGGLPLALRGAAGYLNSVVSDNVWRGEAGIRNFEEYRAAVRQRFRAPLGTLNGDMDESLGLELMQEVSDLSLELLAHRGLTGAAPLLKLFACLSIAPIPYYVLLRNELMAESPLFTEFTALQRHTLLDGLANIGLVEPALLPGVDDPNLAHVFSLHPVIHGILRGDDDVHQRRTEYYGLNVRLLLAATDDLDPDYPENWTIWYLLAPHSIEVTRAVLFGVTRLADRRVIVSALRLARFTSRYLIVAGLIEPASEFVLAIIDNCRAFGFHEDDVEILALRHEKARIALERGDPRAAEEELRLVIAAREKALGANHPDTLASGHKLARAILEQGRFAEAEALLRSIVQAEQKVRGPEHSDTMVVRHSLARAILAQNRAAEAEDMCREILEVRYRLWSPATPETLFVRQTLARSLLEQGKVEEAEAEVRDALAVAEAHPDAPIALALRHTLTTVQLMEGRMAEAEAELASLLDDRRRVLGPSHPETERTADDLTKVRQERPGD